MEDTENEYIPPNHDYGSMEIKRELLLTDEFIESVSKKGRENIFTQMGFRSGAKWARESLRLKHEELEKQNNILRSMYNGAIDDLNWERNNKKAAHEEEVKELKIQIARMFTLERVNEVINQASKSAWIAAGGEESEWKAWDKIRNKLNINNT